MKEFCVFCGEIVIRVYMDIELLKKILMNNRRMISRIGFIERDILPEAGLNYVFVGLRQAGKSFLMYQRIHQLLKAGHSMDEISSSIFIS